MSSFDDYVKNMFSSKAEEQSHRTRLLIETDGIRNLLIGSIIHIDDGRNITVDEIALNNIVFTENKTILWSVIQDSPHFIVGIEYDQEKYTSVQVFDVPDKELGCHHNEICSCCGSDIYKQMKYCYECGKKLIFPKEITK